MSKKNLPTDVFKQVNMHGGDTNVCWEWTGKTNAKDGRPYFTVEGKRRPSYSYVLELHSGEKPERKMVTHSCDNRVCCNPYHLSWGTHQSNMDEMVERNRHGLPATVVRSIRKLLQEGRSHSSIAELYGVSREAITAINNKRSPKYNKETT